MALGILALSTWDSATYGITGKIFNSLTNYSMDLTNLLIVGATKNLPKIFLKGINYSENGKIDIWKTERKKNPSLYDVLDKLKPEEKDSLKGVLINRWYGTESESSNQIHQNI